MEGSCINDYENIAINRKCAVSLHIFCLYYLIKNLNINATIPVCEKEPYNKE